MWLLAVLARLQPAAESQAEDESSLRRLASGDQTAAAGLYDRHARPLYSLILRILGNETEAEDVLQDVFAQAFRQASRYDARRGAVAAWLLTIARSRALDHLRRAEPAEAHPDPAVLDPAGALARGDDPQDLLLAVQGQAALMRALEQLSALQRQLIALAFFRGLTHQEIAEHARLPLGSVKTYIRRALAQLRAQLGTLH